MKKPASIAVCAIAVATLLLLVSRPADARAHRHWHNHYSDNSLYYDYSYSNVQSPATYIYPAANWGPFFYRVRHYGPLAGPLPYTPRHIY
jgi:hypothetical protein